MREELIQVRIPPEPNWTTERDRKYTEDLLGDDYGFDDALVRCFDSLRDLSAAMRRALAYLDANVDHRVDLTVTDLIDLVEQQLRARLSSQKYREFLAEDLTVCRFVNDEFHRVLGIYVANQDLKWMAPMADLGDWIISSVVWFYDGLATVYPDFKRDETVGVPKQMLTTSAVCPVL